MEVPGKKKDTQENKRSPSTPGGPLCQPCSADGEDLDADGFCEHCQEYLCGTCVRYHKKATLSKHHVILNKKKMPRNFVPQTTKICTEICSKHVLEVIKFFCKDHETVECGTCIVLDHKSCSVDFIPDIVDDFVNGEEFSQLLERIDLLRSNVASLKKELEQREKTVAKAYGKAVEDIKTFRKEIDVYLDQIEESIIKECKHLQKENEEAIKNINHNLAAHETELVKLYDRLTCRLKKTGDLFVHAKQTNTRLDELKREIKRGSEHVVKKFKFERDKDLDKIFTLKSTFGELILDTPGLQVGLSESADMFDFVPVFAGEINVKSPSDSDPVYISNMLAISVHTLLCVDRNNRSVKVVDTENRCIHSQLTLSSGPWDITAVSKDQVSVTLPDIEEIDFISLKERELSLCRKMTVSGKCRGVAYYDNMLFVSYEEPKIEIMRLSGEVIKIIEANKENGIPLQWPGCVDVGNHGNCMFVSDLISDCMFKIGSNGELLGTYEGMDLKCPRALSVCRDGSVLVCSSEGHTVHLISPGFRKVKILLTKPDAAYAQSVCFIESKSTLFLYNYDDTRILQCSDYGVIRVYRNA